MIFLRKVVLILLLLLCMILLAFTPSTPPTYSHASDPLTIIRTTDAARFYDPDNGTLVATYAADTLNPGGVWSGTP